MQQVLTKHQGIRNIQQVRAKIGIQIALNSLFRFCWGFGCLFYSRIINSLVAIQHFNSSWPTPSQWKSTNMTWSWEETNCSPHLLSWQKHPWFLIFSPQSSPNLFVILQEPQKVGTIRSSSLVWKLPRILHTIYFPQIPSIFPSNLKCLQNFLG